MCVCTCEVMMGNKVFGEVRQEDCVSLQDEMRANES